MLDLINKYRDYFAIKLNEVGKTSATEISIKLTDDIPVAYRPYRLSFSDRKKVREIVDELPENNIIRESTSPYLSPVLLVKKKNGEMRMWTTVP